MKDHSPVYLTLEQINALSVVFMRSLSVLAVDTTQLQSVEDWKLLVASVKNAASIVNTTALASIATHPEAYPCTYVNPSVLSDAEDAECVRKLLDDLRVPKADPQLGGTFSLLGRVQYAIESNDAAELLMLRNVYAAARGLLRFNGVDDAKAIRFVDALREDIDKVNDLYAGYFNAVPEAYISEVANDSPEPKADQN
jgi:hypothetical protein